MSARRAPVLLVALLLSLAACGPMDTWETPAADQHTLSERVALAGRPIVPVFFYTAFDSAVQLPAVVRGEVFRDFRVAGEYGEVLLPAKTPVTVLLHTRAHDSLHVYAQLASINGHPLPRDRTPPLQLAWSVAGASVPVDTTHVVRLERMRSVTGGSNDNAGAAFGMAAGHALGGSVGAGVGMFAGHAADEQGSSVVVTVAQPVERLSAREPGPMDGRRVAVWFPSVNGAGLDVPLDWQPRDVWQLRTPAR